MKSNRLKWYQQKWFLILYICICVFMFLLWLAIRDTTSFILFLIATFFIHKTYRYRKQGIQRLNNTEDKTKKASKSITAETDNEFITDKKENFNSKISYSFEPLAPEDNEFTQFHIRKQQEKEKLSEINFSYSKLRKLRSDFTVIDFETTGLSPIGDEIIQVAAVKYRNLEKVDEYTRLINPLIPIPAHITKINGITDEDVQGCLTIGEVLPSLLEFIEDDVIVAHNASFDMKFLLAKMHENGIEYQRFRVIDTLFLARKHIDFTKNHKLETMKSFLRLNHLSSHNALHDCYVTAELYKYCYKESTLSLANQH